MGRTISVESNRNISSERQGRKKRDERALIWIEELVQIAEESASSPVYPLLKRVDERHVTMQAYDNPVFVEDIVRNVSSRLRGDSRVSWFKVHAVNHESIHNHSAFACLRWQRPDRVDAKVTPSENAKCRQTSPEDFELKRFW